MPFIKSASKKATNENYHEFRHGPTFAKTERKFGKEKAIKQMSAAVLSNKRRAMKRGGGK